MSNVSQFSTTAASNNSASPNGFPEGMSPAGLNDSARELMAALAKCYKDQNGTITTGGTTTAYTLTTNNSHAALTDISLFAFQVNAANTGAATLAVDGLTAKSMQLNGAALAAGDLRTNEIVLAVYNPDNDVFDIFKASSALLDEDNMTSDSATHGATQQSIKAYVDATSSVVAGQKSGLILSNNSTDSDHDIDVTAGKAADSTDSAYMTVSAITKRIDATWSSGTGNGGLSSSLTAPANNTWYHVFIVKIGGSDDVLFDTSVTCANGVTDHSVTHYRRIGSVKTDSSANIKAFIQVGSVFRWSVPANDINTTNPGTSAVTATLSVPLSANVLANVAVNVTSSSSTNNPILVLLTSPDQADTVPNTTSTSIAANVTAGSAHTSGGMVDVLTNTSSQIRYRVNTSDAASTIRINTHGWRDFF